MSIQVSLNGVTEFVHQKRGSAGTANFDGGIPRGPVEGSDSSFTWNDSTSSGLIDPVYLGIDGALRVWSVSITMSGQSTWSLNKISGLTSVELVSGTTESSFVLGNQLVLNEGEKLSLVTTGAGTTFVKFAVAVSDIAYVGQGPAAAFVTNAIDINSVHIRGDETIDGVKTFVRSPIVPAPSTSQSATNKAYVDSVAATGATPEFASPVGTFVELRALAAPADREVRLVEDAGALYRYDQNTGAGVPDDNDGTIKPNSVNIGANGRWYKVSSSVQPHNDLIGLQGGAVGDYQHLTSDQLSAIAGTSGSTVGPSNKLVDNSDARLSDARSPLAHAASHGVAGSDAITISQSQVSGLDDALEDIATAVSLKANDADVVKLTGNQSVAGTKTFTGAVLVQEPVVDGHPATKAYVDTGISNVASTLSTLPTTGEKAALVGTSGSPGPSNKYVTDSDARLSDARDPNAHALTHQVGGADELTLQQSQVSGLSDALSLKANNVDVVKLTGDQSIAGAKTFTGAVSVLAPVGDSNAATKLYVDTEVGNVAGTLTTLPTADEKAALSGTSGTPDASNKYVTNADVRLSDSRTPVSHASTHESGGADEIELAQSQVTGLEQSLTTLSNSVATKAADADVVKLTGDQSISGIKTFVSSPVVPAPTADSDAATKKYADDAAAAAVGVVSSNVPTTDEKAALAGTSGVPSVANKYVTNSDARLSDARNPNAHALTHGASGSDAITVAQSQVTNLEQDLLDIQTELDTKAAANAVVNLVDNQSIGGVKTFTSSPVVPVPVSSGQAATKGYVDDSVTGVAVTFSAPVGTAGELRAIPASELADRQVRLVEDLGALYRYDSSGTGSDDGDGTIKPADVDVASTGRWFKTSAATQNHESLTGVEGGAVNDRQHLTTDQVSYIPSSDQKAALAGTSGTPGSANKYVTDSDTRLVNSREPTGAAGGSLSGTYPNPGIADDAIITSKIADGAVTGAKIASGTITDANVSVLHVDGLAGTPSLRTLGTGAQQAAAGNDARLSDARTPTVHASTHELGGTDEIEIAQSQVSGLDLALGSKANDSDVVKLTGDQSIAGTKTFTGSVLVQAPSVDGNAATKLYVDTAVNTAVSGVSPTVPTTDEKAALAGTAGSPSSTNKYVTNSDARLSDARMPTGAAGGDLTGTYPDPTISNLAVTTAKIADSAVTGAKIASSTITDANVSASNIDGAANVPSLRTLGTGASQATAGNDARLSDARTPLSHASSHQPGGSDVLALQQSQVGGLVDDLAAKALKTTKVDAGPGLTGGGDLSADRTISMPDVGTAGVYGSASSVAKVTTDAQGRVSAAESVSIAITQSQVTGLDSALSAKANDADVVKLTGAQSIDGVKTFTSSPSVPTPVNNTDASTKKYVDDTAAAAVSGVSPNVPTADQKAALAGTDGLPSSANKYVTDSDARMSNSRTPLSHAASHGVSGSDAITVAISQVSLLDTALDSKALKTTLVEGADGLTGGGDLSANRTISMPNVGTAGTYGSESSVPVLTTDSKGRVSSVTSTQISVAKTQVSGLTDDLSAKADKSTTVTGTDGLTGGGDLSANRTISLPAVGTAGTYGSATSVAAIVTDAKGRVSSATSTPIQIAQTQVDNLVQDLGSKAADNAVVHLAGAESITGVKNFTASPQVPNPVNNAEAANKNYVDTQISAVSGNYASPVQDVAALRAVTGAQDKQIRLVESVGAIYRFDAQASGTDDGAGTIVPTSGGGTWYKVSAATQNHSDLTGLLGGDAGTGYYHLTSSELGRIPSADVSAALAGTTGTPGSANKYVTDTDTRLSNARTPTSHKSTHAPGGVDALDVGTPVSIGTLNSEGTALTYVRSDHVHAHGDLAGGTLHGVATTSTAGFMSAEDKTKLDTIAGGAGVGGSGTAGQVAYWSSGSAVTSSSKLQWDNSTNKLSIDPVAAADSTVRRIQIGPEIITYDNTTYGGLQFGGVRTTGVWTAAGPDPLATHQIRAVSAAGLKVLGSGSGMVSPFISVYTDTPDAVTNSAHKLFAVRNNGVEKASFDKDGALTSPQMTVFSGGDTTQLARIYRDASRNLVINIPAMTESSDLSTLRGLSFVYNDGVTQLPRVFFGGTANTVAFYGAYKTTGTSQGGRFGNVFSTVNMTQENVMFMDSASAGAGTIYRAMRGTYANPFRTIHGDPLGFIGFDGRTTVDTDFTEGGKWGLGFMTVHQFGTNYSDAIFTFNRMHTPSLNVGSYLDATLYGTNTVPTVVDEAVVLNGTTPVTLAKPLRAIVAVRSGTGGTGTVYNTSSYTVNTANSTIVRNGSTIPDGSTVYVTYTYRIAVNVSSLSATSLGFANVRVSSVASANSGGASYTRSTDYSLDESAGTITRLPSSTQLTEGSTVYVTLSYVGGEYWSGAQTLPRTLNVNGGIALRNSNSSSYTYGSVDPAGQGSLSLQADVLSLASNPNIQFRVQNAVKLTVLSGTSGSDAVSISNGYLKVASDGIKFNDGSTQTIASPRVYNTGFNLNEHVAAFEAQTSTASVAVAISPVSGGPLQRRVPDGTTTGGNLRGQSATDWQASRNVATQVASGVAATISGGERNTASGNYSTVPGGYSNIASGAYSTAIGNGASTKSTTGKLAFASSSESAGSHQYGVQVTRSVTSNATPKSLTTDGGVPAGTNGNVIDQYSTCTVVAYVVARSVTDPGTVATWKIEGAVSREGSNAVLLSSPSPISLGSSGTVVGWTCALAVSGNSVYVQVTGQTSKDISWVATMHTTELTTGAGV